MVATYHTLNGFILVNLGDRLEISHSLESRAPFLDNDLSDFIAIIPPKHMLHIPSLTERLVLKEAFRAVLPALTDSKRSETSFFRSTLAQSTQYATWICAFREEL